MLITNNNNSLDNLLKHVELFLVLKRKTFYIQGLLTWFEILRNPTLEYNFSIFGVSGQHWGFARIPCCENSRAAQHSHCYGSKPGQEIGGTTVRLCKPPY